MAGLYLAAALLTWVGIVPLSRGAFLLGAGLETHGPLMFVIFAFLFARAGLGLLRMSAWSRYLTILLACVGIYLLVPAVSSAAIDLRVRGLALHGSQIIARVMVVWYMLQTSVREAFA
jgi:hypothetical protein